ncbi:DUF4344 domain-containing metallopeptidase [Candidatus Nitrospira nitrificans]|uniref:Uncharacterized protein n=1 Tax=Candidatus Nitrospira nitrificans TaxID=1742973 RepID=A0A0S4LK02_9BACT|nr:DUF4344 domain-containing metallopeptidase [Candidatus Nitrospira nitrificans]CUS36262.1 exported hypothetical protein [Candidatus Nitrospira nitrificans]
MCKVTTIALTVSLLLGLSWSASIAGPESQPTSRSFVAEYPDVVNQRHAAYRRAFMEERYVELFAEGLSQSIKLPSPLYIRLEECQQPNAYYAPGPPKIVMCYELFDSFERAFADVPGGERGRVVMGSWLFVFFHELGHALVDQLHIPITGREEDAVDRFSTVLLTKVGEDGTDAALSGAYYFWLSSAKNKDPFSYWLNSVAGTPAHNFADENALNEQRFYNILCWVYGQHPDRYAWVVKNGTLPMARAQRCSHESLRMMKNWEILISQASVQQTAATSAPQSSIPLLSDYPKGRIVGRVVYPEVPSSGAEFSEIFVMLYPATKELTTWFSNPVAVKKQGCLVPRDYLPDGFPRFGDSDTDGSFTINDVLVGTYHLCAVYTWNTKRQNRDSKREAIAVVPNIKVQAGTDAKLTVRE